MKRVEREVNIELEKVPRKFLNRPLPPTYNDEHPIYRTTSHDYGSMAPSSYEVPLGYYTLSRKFTEKQHLGSNYEGGGFNI
jgi:hypothetical protein